MRNKMKKYVYLAVLAAFVPLTVHLLRETRRLRDQVQNLEEERRRTAVAAIAAGWVGISEDEQEKLIGIYRDIAQAYTNQDIMAMHIAMLKLPEVNDHLTWQISSRIEKPLFALFNDTFLRTTRLFDFDTQAQFDGFVKSNIEVALFLGGVYARRKCFDIASFMESLTFQRLKQYEEKFAREGKDEFREVAAKALSLWTAWIESPKGFTRQKAIWEVRTSTEYAEILKPECALPREKALLSARKNAEAMLKPTGLAPAWLSEFGDKQPCDPL